MSLPDAAAEERMVLGSCLLYGRSAKLAVVAGLRPEHFMSPRHKLIFPAILRRYLNKSPVNPVTIAADLETTVVDAAYLQDLAKTASDSAVIDPLPYVERIITVAERRHQWEAAKLIIEGAETGNDEIIAQGLSKSQTSVRLESRDHDAKTASADFAKFLQDPAPIETFALPWQELHAYSPGGLLRHHFVSLIGWSGYGKSIALDEMLRGFSAQGYSCGLYMTEMDRRERIARHVAWGTGIPASSLLMKGRLSDSDRQRAAGWILDNPLPFDPIEAEGWSAMRIRQHAIVHEYDCIAVDTVNNIPHRRREDFEDEIRTLASASKLAGALTIGVFQLNQQRRDGFRDPPPSLRDIRETGLVEHLSDRVLALHIENEDGKQEDDGEIRLLKCRGGIQGGKTEITHRRGRFTFEDAAMKKARERAAESGATL